jgi:hypothetical protein
LGNPERRIFNPVGVGIFVQCGLRVGSFLATLGFGPESLRDSDTWLDSKQRKTSNRAILLVLENPCKIEDEDENDDEDEANEGVPATGQYQN